MSERMQDDEDGPPATFPAGTKAESSRKSTAVEQGVWEHDVFLSYRRLGGAGIARWLHRRLTTYRLPDEVRKALYKDEASGLKVFSTHSSSGRVRIF